MSFLPNEKNASKASLDDVAKALGVSKSTVSRVLSGKGRISEETRNKVMQCAAEMNYQPNVIARGLAQSKTFNIGVVLPYEKDLGEIPFFQNCLTGICETVSSMDYDVVVAMAAADDASQLERIIRNRKVDGVILTRSVINDPAVRLLKENSIPFVLIGSTSDDSVVQIDIDHESACSELTAYLLSRGCSRTALLLGSKSHNVNLSRYNGFVNAYEQSGKAFDAALIYDNLSGRRAVELAVGEIINKGCDCIICGDDYICVRALSALKEKQIAIPEKIKIASFYNSPILQSYTPPITAVNADPFELGETAARTVLSLINDGDFCKDVFLSYELSIKKSTL